MSKKDRLAIVSKEIEERRPIVDNVHWDEADIKPNNHICLSLGAEATNIFHQRFPHNEVQKNMTDALGEKLEEAFVHVMKHSTDSSFSDAHKKNENQEKFFFMDQETSSTIQLAITRRKSGEGYIHAAND